LVIGVSLFSESKCDVLFAGAREKWFRLG